MAQANLIIVKDPFRRHDREIKPVACDQSLLAIRDTLPKDVEFVVSINGKIIPREQLSVIYPGEGDSIVCVPEILDGKTIFRSLLMIAITIAAPFAAAAMGFVTAAGALTVTGMFIAGGIALVGGLLLNVLLPPIRPKLPTMDGFDGSQAYSWNPHSLQTQGVVVPKFYGKNKLYGNIINSHIKYQDGKQYLYALIDLGTGPYKEIKKIKLQKQSEKNYSDVTVGVRKGYLNQEVIKNFTKTKIDYAISNTQLKYGVAKNYTTIGSAFNRLEITVGFSALAKFTDEGSAAKTSVDIKIRIKKQGDADWTIITRQAAKTEDINVATAYWSLGSKIKIKNGGETDAWEEYQAGSSVRNDHAESDEAEAGYRTYQWRWLEAGEIYTKASTFDDFVTYSGKSTKSVAKTFGQNIPDAKLGIHTIEVTRLTKDHDDSPRVIDKSFLTQVTEVIGSKFTYPRHVLVGVKALATDELSDALDFSCIARCALVRIYTGTYPNGAWSVDYSNNPAWVAWDVLTQPVLDDNLAIIRYDGMQPARLDLAKFKEWADFCAGFVYDGKTIRYTTAGSTQNTILLQNGGSDFDADKDGAYPSLLIDPAGGTNYETVAVTNVTGNTLTITPSLSLSPGSGVAVKKAEKRITFNGGFDTGTTVWDAVLTVCQVGRAVPVWNGINLTLAIDKPASPVQLITIGNTVQDSFEETFLSLDERATEVEVDFINSENDYIRDKVTAYNNNISDKNNPVSIELIGITKESEAWRAGMFRLYKNQYIKRFVRNEMDIDAIAFTPGDVINAQCDVPQWGEGGRIVSATSASVTIDKSVTIAAGKSYNIMIRLSTDIVVEKSVTNTPGTYTVLTVSAFSQTPAQYDIYAFGEVTKVVKPFRVVNIEKSQEQKCILELAEYNGSEHNVDTDDPAINTANYSSLDAVQGVQNLTLTELSWIDHSGATRFAIHVDYDLPVDSVVREVKIYYAEIDAAQGGIKYTLNNTKDDIIYDVQPNTTYKVVCVSVNIFSVESALKTSPTATITIGTVPNARSTQLDAGVKGLQIFGQGNDNNFAGRDCKLIWEHVNPVDITTAAGAEVYGAGSGNPIPWFKDYVLEIWDTAATAKLPRRTEFLKTNEYIYSYEKNYENGLVRSFEARLWARDRFNRISKTAARLAVTNPAPKMLRPDGVLIIIPALRRIKGGHRISWTHPYQAKKIPEYDIAYFLLYCDTTINFNSANLKIFTIASLVNGFDPNINAATILYKTEVDGLNPEIPEYYKVVACDSYGEGAASVTVNDKPGLTHDDDALDKPRPARYDHTKLTITPDTEINDDGKTVINLMVKGEKASETDVDGYILEVRTVKDTAAVTPPTGAEIDAGITAGGKKCEGSTYPIAIDGEAGTGTTDTDYFKRKIPDVKNNCTIFLRIKKQNTSGQAGPWSSDSPGAWISFVTTKANSAADTTAPSLPTSVTVTAEQTTLKIKIATTTADRDLAGYQISIKEGASEGATVAFASDHAANVKTSIAVTADNATATYNYTGKAGFNYVVAANAYDKSGNVNSGWTAASAQVLLEGLSLDGLSEAIAMAIYTGEFTATDADTVTWGNGDKVKIKRNGNIKEYTIANGTTGNLAGTRYIVFNKATSTTALSIVTTPGDADIVIATVEPVISGKVNIKRHVGKNDGDYTIGRFAGYFNQLSAMVAEFGRILMVSGGFTKILIDSTQTPPVIRVAKDGYNATETDPDKLRWSSEFNNFKIIDQGVGAFTLPGYTVIAGGYNSSTVIIKSSVGIATAKGVIGFSDIGGGYGIYRRPLPIKSGYGNSESFEVSIAYSPNDSAIICTSEAWNWGAGTQTVNALNFNLAWYLLGETL